MESIEVRYKYLFTYPVSGQPIYHKYIIYTDNAGTEWIARGGPSVKESLQIGQLILSGHEFLGTIVTTHGVYDSTSLDWDNTPESPDFSEVISVGSDLSGQWQSITDIVDQIETQNHGYNFLYANSNSVVDTALYRSGLSQPTEDDNFEYLSPASGHIIPNSIEINPVWEIIKNLFNVSLTRGSPLVLDLDTVSGIQLSSISSTGSVYWDIDNDGFREKSGWIAGGDGFLVIDRNGDGEISSNSELFGNDANFANGFLALDAYDTNNDNFITSADAQFNGLKVWIDANHNGVSESTELYTLSALGITSITTTWTDVNVTNNGNTIKQTSTFMQNGASKTIVDAWFAYDNMNTVYNETFSVDIRVLNLPIAKGYGNLPDLYISASLNNTGTGNLLDKLTALDTETFAQIFDSTSTLKTDIRNILFKWAGVDGVGATSRGPIVNGQELAFLEKLMGQKFLQQGVSENPYGTEAGYDLQEAFSVAFNNFYARLVSQAAGGQLFTGNWNYDVTTDTFSGVTGLDITKLNELKTEALALSTSAARETFWENVVRMVEYSVGTANLPAASLTALQNAITQSDATLSLSGTVLPALVFHRPAGVDESGTTGNDVMNGSSGDDTLRGWYGNDTINGLAGNDTIHGESDNDTLNGGTGNDYLLGYTGVDTYIYNVGDGSDTISEAGAGVGNIDDTILFGAGIVFSNLTMQKLGSSTLLISIGGATPGQIVIEGQFSNSGPVEKLQFNDGSIYTLTDKAYTSLGTSQNDTIDGIVYGGLTTDTIYLYDGNDTSSGGDGNDVIYGGNGNDILNGDNGDDILYGDAGNDKLTGGSGNDIYVYSGGNDIVYEFTSLVGTDEIRLVSGITAANLTFTRITANDLKIDVTGFGSITIQNQFFGSSYAIETIRFADNSTIDLLTKTFTTQGTIGNDSWNGISTGGSTTDTMYMNDGNDVVNAGAGNDTVYGGNGNDTLNGDDGDDVLYGEAGDNNVNGGNGNDTLSAGLGNDTMRGGSGNDIYVYSGGNDIVYEFTSLVGTDEIRLVSGITAANLTFTRITANDLKIDVTGFGSITIQNQFFGNSYAIETIRFADNSTIDLLTKTFITQGTVGNDSWNGIATGGSTTDTMYMNDGNDVVNAGAGNDTVYGGNGNDTLNGDDGDDVLYGEAGDNNVNGGNGNDTLSAGLGNDTMRGGSGNDIYVYSGGNDIVYEFTSLVGTDEIRLVSGITAANLTFTRITANDLKIDVTGFGSITIQNQFFGNSYAIETIRFADNSTIDLLTKTFITQGTVGNDSWNGIATGGSTTDTMYMNDGNDVVNAGAGNDTVYGGNGNDTLNGDDGDDVLYGGAGDDIMNGGNGIDTVSYSDATAAVTVNLTTTTSQNTIGAGLDTIGTVENLIGSALNDTLTGNTGNNVIEGGAGNDTLNGSTGADTVSYISATAGVTVNLALATAQNTVGAGTDTIAAFENILGSGFNDTLTGDGNANTIEGGLGNDILNGGAGVDTVSYAAATAAVTVNLATTTAQNIIGAGTDTITGFENILGSGFNDTLTGDGNANTITGGDGNDLMQGGLGNDILVGGNGIDTVSYASATAAITFSLATTTAQNTINAGTDTVSGFENILGSGFNDTLTGDGNANTIEGGLGNDVLNGGLGIDTVSYAAATGAVTVDLAATIAQNTGAAGTDTLSNFENIFASAFSDTLAGTNVANVMEGNAGNDIIYGMSGADTLIGGLGADTLNGGLDADTFKYLTSGLDANSDHIMDFSIAQGDKIDIKDLLVGYDALTSVITNFIDITTSGTNSLMKVDRDGAGTAYTWQQIAIIDNVTGLTDEAALKASGNLIVA